MPGLREAPPIQAASWFNVTDPPTLEALRGRVVVLYAFQMLCPGCHQHATPQTQRVHESFSRKDVAVIGLHSVFEDHEAQSPERLAAYLRDERLTFPVAVDAPAADNDIPLTMQALQLDGTPTTLLLDRQGRIRLKRFGYLTDLELGAAIGRLLAEN